MATVARGIIVMVDKITIRQLGMDGRVTEY